MVVGDRVEKLTGIRKAMVKSMHDALKIPHFGYCDEISADSLIRYVFISIYKVKGSITRGIFHLMAYFIVSLNFIRQVTGAYFQDL